MRHATIARVGMALVLGACSGSDTPAQRDTTASGTIAASAATPADTANSRPDSAGGMAGMDHSKMPGMGVAPATRGAGGKPATSPDPMAGMDHSKMPGMGGAPAPKAAGGQPRTPPDPMAGMDHSKMPGMSGGRAPKPTGGNAAKPSAPMAGMDHSKMDMSGAAPSAPSRRTTAPQATAMAGMDHSTMPMGKTATPPPADPAMQKLQQIVAKLVQDSVVQRRIREDSVLRNGWNDPALKRTIETRP